MIKKAINKYKSMSVLVKASLWFLICSFMQKGVTIITTPIFTRLMSTEEYGQYSVFMSWMDIITIFVTLKLSSGVYMQGLVKFDKEKDLLSSSLQGLSLILTGIWTVVYIVFKTFWNGLFELTTVQMYSMLLLIWSSNVFSFWSVEKRVNLSYVSLVLVTFAVTIAKPLLQVFAVICADDKVTARILTAVFVQIAFYTPLFVKQVKAGRHLFSKKYWKYALAFNLPLIPHYLSEIVLNSSDRIMIQRMIGDSEAGLYSLAFSISHAVMIFNTAMLNTISPWFYKKIKEKSFGEIAPVGYVALLISAILNVLLIALAPEIVKVFAPKGYYAAIWVIPPITISVYFLLMYNLFACFEFYYEKTKYISLATMLGAIINVILNYHFIILYGFIAAGYTTLICYLLYTSCHYIVMRQICNKKLNGFKVYDLRKLTGLSVVFSGLSFMLMFTYNYTNIRYVIIVIIMIILIVKRKIIGKQIKNIIGLRKSPIQKGDK